uniref:putative sperm motility kinase W n=1 Tax=Ictidomys tridecemlineatus TaxID=43179 RepID=UPI001A9ECE8A|nr:putative sperm motility kinase W [Ictidomys tridecemlineatus]
MTDVITAGMPKCSLAINYEQPATVHVCPSVTKTPNKSNLEEENLLWDYRFQTLSSQMADSILCPRMSSESSQSSAVLQGWGSCCEPSFTDHYKVLQDIGKGGFSRLKLACYLLTGTEVAVKVLVKVASIFPLFSESYMRTSLDHPNEIQLFQVIETSDYFYMIMGLAGGGWLWDFIPSDGIQDDEAHKLFRQLMHAMQYCHKQGIMHLDLKPQNIMVDDSGNVELIDFGLSTRFTAGEKLKRIWGTCLSFAPELTQGEEYEGPPADVWSLGIVLYFMLTGRCPFRAASREQLKKLITQGTYDIPQHVSEGAQRLVNEILMVDPMQWPSIEQSSSPLRRPSSPSRGVLEVPVCLPSLSTSLPARPCVQQLILPRFLHREIPLQQQGLEEAEEEDRQMHVTTVLRTLLLLDSVQKQRGAYGNAQPRQTELTDSPKPLSLWRPTSQCTSEVC